MSISPERLSEVHAKINQLGPDAKILDVGGGMCPLGVATHIVDFLPFRVPEKSHGVPSKTFEKSDWFQVDINRSQLPFTENYFDFVFCSHTLEDIVFPFNAMDEMMRVGKQGYIETPSTSWEITKSVQAKGICGGQHHKWCVDVDAEDKNCLVFLEKSDCLYKNILYHQSKGAYLKSRDSDACHLFWKGSFRYKHITNFDTFKTYERYNALVTKNSKVKRIISNNRVSKSLFNRFLSF